MIDDVSMNELTNVITATQDAIFAFQQIPLSSNKKEINALQRLHALVHDFTQQINDKISTNNDENTTAEWIQNGYDFASTKTVSTPTTINGPTIWSGFYKKSVRERQDVLVLKYPRLFEKTKKGTSLDVRSIGDLPEKVANLMIENCIGVLGIPLGMAPNFVIDGKQLVIPMAVEEPSVIAAASGAAKLLCAGNRSFITYVTGNIMTSQIQLIEITDLDAAESNIGDNERDLIDYANAWLCSSMKKRGGGVIGITTRRLKKQPANLVVHVQVDVQEAMGANTVNTIAEGLAEKLVHISKASRCGLRIVTNFCRDRRTKATFTISVKELDWKGVSGLEVATSICEASEFGWADPYRACTNNKGILNGIDAVALATGQDWRAIEAAAHCYASRNGTYQPLTQYHIIEEGRTLQGEIELPLAVGTKGGATQTHPGYKANLSLLKNPNNAKLCGIIAAVGLAQNFSALRALAVTGIQRGHMGLHARNIAVAAGTPEQLIPELCAHMVSRGKISLQAALEYLKAHDIYIATSPRPPDSPPHESSLSMFYIEVPLESKIVGHGHSISINIAYGVMETLQHVVINEDCPTAPSNLLLGDKGFVQMKKMLSFLSDVSTIIACSDVQPSTLPQQLRLLSLVLNVMTFQLTLDDSNSPFLQALLHCPSLFALDASAKRKLLHGIPSSSNLVRIGAPIILALLQVLQYHIEQEVESEVLRHAVLKEQERCIHAIIRQSYEDDLEAYMGCHVKRWQATMFLLLDAAFAWSVHETLQKERIQYLCEIGEYLEWEGTTAHDISRHVPGQDVHLNAVAFYERLHGETKPNNFQEFSTTRTKLLWNSIWAQRNAEYAKCCTLSAVSHVVELIRCLYGRQQQE